MGKEEVRIKNWGMRNADCGSRRAVGKKEKVEIRNPLSHQGLPPAHATARPAFIELRHGDQDAVDKLSGIAKYERRSGYLIFSQMTSSLLRRSMRLSTFPFAS